MAYSDDIKKIIIAEFKTGKYSQRELSEKHGVSLGTVNKITKGKEKENEQLVNAQVSILSAKALLPLEEMNAIMNAAQEEMYNKNLVTNATQLNLIRTTEYLSNNKKLVKLSAGMGAQELVEVGLGSSDFKECQEAIDKASLTLGINQRHANIKIDNTNAQQNNYSPQEISQAIADGLPD